MEFEADQVPMRAWLAFKTTQVVLSVGEKDRFGAPGFTSTKLRLPKAVASVEALDKGPALNLASCLRRTCEQGFIEHAAGKRERRERQRGLGHPAP